MSASRRLRVFWKSALTRARRSKRLSRSAWRRATSSRAPPAPAPAGDSAPPLPAPWASALSTFSSSIGIRVMMVAPWLRLLVALEHFLELVHEAPPLRHGAAVLGRAEFAQQGLLPFRELPGDLYQNLDQFVAVPVGAQVG